MVLYERYRPRILLGICIRYNLYSNFLDEALMTIGLLVLWVVLVVAVAAFAIIAVTSDFLNEPGAGL